MKKIFNDLYVTEAERPFQNVVRTISYFIKSQKENYIIYSSKFFKEEKIQNLIKELGGVKAQILNHRDEASEILKEVRVLFSSKLVCHHLEEEVVKQYSEIDVLIRDEKILFDQFEVLHTPGHAPGSTCYLYHGVEGNYLFTGDTLYLAHGQFKVAVSEENKEQIIESLLKLKQFEVDYIYPGLFIGQENCRKFAHKDEFGQMIDDVVTSLRE
ncbi:MBL fold metallo-hydrolase [bacterium]|nr:MBL fold metallo-hydrolase [bacterium]